MMPIITYTLVVLAATLSYGFDSVELLNKHDNCTSLKHEFAKSNTEFSVCAAENADPVECCRKCVTKFISTTDAWDSLLSGINNDNVTSCKNLYINRDRLNVIQRLHDCSVSLWNAAACSNCFISENGTLTNKISTETEIFYSNLDPLKHCIATNKTICSTCAPNYDKLNNHFNQIKKEFGNYLCFDIVDAMNRTQQQWSSELKCCKDRDTSIVSFIAVSSTIGCLPVLFYLGFFFSTSRSQRSEYITGGGVDGGQTSTSVTVETKPSTSACDDYSITNESKKLINTESSDDELLE